MAKQDRQGVRKPSDLERKYNFEKRFDDAMEAAADAKKTAQEVDKNLDAEEVFNRLTDGGKQQGVYKGEDGNIYINASYIKTGIILASLITAGILQSQDKETFYLDLEKGVLKGKFTEFSISGKTVDEIAQGKADTAQSNSNKYTDDRFSSQTQESVYNVLTNNGKAEGIYVIDGNLFINASYIVAGIIKSADGKTFYLDLENNELKGEFTELTSKAFTANGKITANSGVDVNGELNVKDGMVIGGKTVSWKENEDGEFVLIGE